MLALYIVIGYIVLGALTLGVMELTTKRISQNLPDAYYDAQETMARAGVPMDIKKAKVVIKVVTMIFWPAVLLGSFLDLFRR